LGAAWRGMIGAARCADVGIGVFLGSFCATEAPFLWGEAEAEKKRVCWCWCARRSSCVVFWSKKRIPVLVRILIGWEKRRPFCSVVKTKRPAARWTTRIRSRLLNHEPANITRHCHRLHASLTHGLHPEEPRASLAASRSFHCQVPLLSFRQYC